MAAVNARRVKRLKRRWVGSEMWGYRRCSGMNHMKLLLFVLFGHVCLVGLGKANLVEVTGDHLDDAFLTFENMRSHACLRVDNNSRLRVEKGFQCVVVAKREKGIRSTRLSSQRTLDLRRISEGF